LFSAWNDFRGVGVHIGGLKVDGIWKWVGRVIDPIVVGDWKRGQPQGNPGEDCLAHWNDHKWHDIGCTDILLTACEYSA